MQKNLIFIGLRASGKSHIGSSVAEILKLPFYDLDKVIEKKIKMTITHLVKTRGWDTFRAIESKACHKAAEKEGCVIATGGGAVMNDTNTHYLKQNGFVVFLRAPIADLAKRLESSTKNSHRPSLTGKSITEELEELWQERKAKYQAAADLIFDCPTISGDKKADVRHHSQELAKLLQEINWQKQ